MENWRERGKQGWEVIQNAVEESGDSVTYDNQKHILTFVYNHNIENVKTEEEGINSLVSDVVMSQFFVAPDNLLSLTTIVKDKNGNILGQVEWPETTGYFSNMK